MHGLGVVLFECLTLRSPFTGRTREALYREILERAPPDPRGPNPLVPRDLVTVLRTAMAKDPAHRYQSAAAFADDLRRVRLGLPVAARRASFAARAWQWTRRHRAAAALLAALSLTQATVGVQAWRAHAGSSRSRAARCASR